jgi:hypothetical protein
VLCSLFRLKAKIDKEKIKSTLDNWHKAAGEAQFDAYLTV